MLNQFILNSTHGTIKHRSFTEYFKLTLKTYSLGKKKNIYIYIFLSKYYCSLTKLQKL